MANTCSRCRADNPETQRFCGECGTPLPSGNQAPGPDAPRAGGIPPSSMTETLQTPVRELTTGSTFAGRYQVIEELGHGGMGKVYKVFDTDIKEKIALKLLRPEIALDKETIERFSNELKLARKISHRNVCRMFDLGKSEGTTFITMEFVPGEDLKKLIRKTGQLGAGRAVSIAKQVCAGLAEAHHLETVHRDLKPQNIMVDEDGNARIMDFGIARSLRGKGITGAGVMIGTPEYMSPEQVEGKEVDERSDIYSLGVILFELVTGHVPFEGDTPFTIGVKHKSERPRNPRELNAHVPEELSQAILRCLEKDKTKRFQTAEELWADLEKVEQGLPTTERLAPKRRPMTSREITVTFSAKKLIVPALIFFTLIASGFFLWRILASKKPTMPPSSSGQPTLAVVYFENKSGDEKLDIWRDGLPELLITALSQSKYVRVITGDEMLTILRRLGLAEAQEYSSEDIGKIAAQARATYVLKGSFIKAGESIIITAGLQKPGTGEAARALRFEASNEKDIIAKVDELSRQVKEGLNLTAAQIAGDVEKEVGIITTSSPEALKYYIQGRRYHQKVEYAKAIANMEKAVEIDPEFSLAYRSLAVAHFNSGHDLEGRKFMKKALGTSHRLPENERLFIEAVALYFDEDYRKAIEVLDRLLKAYPGHLAGHAYLGNIYGTSGDWDNAIGEYEFLLGQNRRTGMYVGNLAIFYASKGLYQKAEDVCLSFLQDVEDNAYVRQMLMYSYLCRRRFDLALAEAEKIYLLDPTQKSNIGLVLLCKDDLAGAEKNLGGDELLLIRGQFNKYVNLSRQNLEKSKGDKEKESRTYGEFVNALYKAGHSEDAYQAFVQYLRLSSEYRKSSGESSPPYLPSQQKSDLFIKGRIQAGLRSFAEAEKTAGELKALIDKGINKKELRRYEYILGLVELGKENYRKAAEFFTRACGRLDIEFWYGAQPDHALCFAGLARALYEEGDLDAARKTYEKITLLTYGRIDDGDVYAKAFYMLGKIAEQQGDKPRARENYRKFLDLWKDADPGQPEVEDAKARMQQLNESVLH